MICPQCNEPKAHRSHRKSLQDKWMSLWGSHPYRCHNCHARFYAYRDGEKDDKLRTAEEQRIMKIRRQYKWRQTRRQILAFSICAVLAILAIYLIIQERVPRGE
jgi:hypothetical protein